MTRDAETVEHHLERLDAEACAEFVADLWAARGFETRREGSVVVATRHGESTALYPTADSRLRSPTAPDRPVDVVVDPRGGRDSGRIAEANDARLLDAAALREVLWYGVDRATAAALCDRHLGAPPADLSRPLGRRVRAAARGAGPGAGAVLVATLALLVGGVVAPGLVASPGDAADATDASTDGDVELGAATVSRPSGPSAVPGLGPDGIEDPSALAVAHRRATEERSYTLWMDYRGPDGDPAGRVHRDVDVAVQGREYVAVTTVEGNDRAPTETVYHDRTGWYVARRLDGNVSYGRVGAGDGGPYGVPNPDETGRTLVRRYLSTPETSVDATVVRDGRTLYRVVGEGTPSGLGGGTVGNYSFRALVTTEGFVVDLTVHYSVVVDGQRVAVTREWTYGRVGETSVDAPDWYEQRFGGEQADPDAGDD